MRPYLAKPFVPGNTGWDDKSYASMRGALFVKPDLFYDLDYSTCASALTHPDPTLRYAANAAYLTLCSFYFIGKSLTIPSLPQGNGGVWARAARVINKLVPLDR